jgi:hypothetical protein
MNSNYSLSEAILDSELRHVSFFNGRLLTGGDLEAEQSVQHAHARHLGEATGEGVSFGLSVTRAEASPPEGPVVSVTRGLAVNRAGQTLRLECDQRVALTTPPDPAAQDACVFDECDPASSGATLGSGTGYYVLTIGPASRPDGKAPVSGLGNTTAICNSRFSAEGVRFDAFRLNLPADGTPKARSLLAKACFGLTPAISAGAWPGSLPVQYQYGWETLMPPGFDANFHVPLAVFEWTIGGPGFVKCWPVRRRIERRNPVTNWAYFSSARRGAEGEAMFFDFQVELDAQAPAGFAGDRFALLPAGGVLPAGANWKAFLGPLAPSFATPMDASLWSRLLRDSFTREPVAIPAANAKNFGDPSFAALKVYKVPERAELLFARSPLGRLRIFPNPQNEGNMVIVAVRDANGAIRQSELPESTSWPVIVDDLPGGTAEIWFLAPMARILEGDFSGNETAAPGAAQSSAKSTRKKTSAKSKKAGAKADAPEIIAAEQIKIEGVRGEFTSDIGGGVFGQRMFAPHLSVNIVNGRTTDVEIPSEAFKSQEPDL